jgi:hypothetical protein
MAKAQNAAKTWCLTIELDDFTVYKPIDETAGQRLSSTMPG